MPDSVWDEYHIVQATARNILCYAMNTLRCCSIVMHIHDEVVIEADRRKEIINNCPESVDVTLRAPVASKASAASIIREVSLSGEI